MSESPVIGSVTVYCASARNVRKVFYDAARETGRQIACRGWTLVYGGNYCGPMGALADGAREAGGRVVGITPRFLVERGIADRRCDELVVTDDMHQRKAALSARGDAFICLPGGIGTLEELMETLAWRELRLHRKPVVLVNISGYYDHLLRFLADAARGRFLRDGFMGALGVAADVAEAIGMLNGAGRPL